jgi:hypothetical protein
MRRSSFSFGTTSDNSTPLTRDDGGVRDYGAIDEDHIDCGRGRGDPKDYGPDVAADHIDESALQSPPWAAGQGYTSQPDPRGPTWSAARARASSGSEWLPDSWYGGPSKRQGG